MITASGCIQQELYTDKNSLTKTETTDSGSFVKAAENLLKIHIFDGTVIENIISPDIFTEIGQYPMINYEMSHVSVPTGKENYLHLLRSTSETVYVVSGTASAEVNGICYNLTAGDALFIPKNAVQKIGNTKDTELSYLSVTYPPYNSINEQIIDETFNELVYASDEAVFKGNNDSAKEIFFGDVEICNIFNPEILKNSGISYDFGIGIAKAAIPPGSLTTPHILEGTTEVIYVLSGEGILHVNRNTMTIKPGDTAYIPPGAYQSLENSGDVSLIYVTLTDPPYSESVDSAVVLQDGNS
ncbi:MAG: cupin domain-containing protein [Methanomicrobium sp.]|nr:cupin domain-containing protein [Methanomicrobium sp.]